MFFWFYYVVSYRGICIGFCMVGFVDFNCVEYVDEFFKLYVNLNFVDLMRVVVMKVFCWVYEKEWRFVFRVGSVWLWYDVSVFSELVFGLRIMEENEWWIFEFVCFRDLSFKLFCSVYE